MEWNKTEVCAKNGKKRTNAIFQITSLHRSIRYNSASAFAITIWRSFGWVSADNIFVFHLAVTFVKLKLSCVITEVESLAVAPLALNCVYVSFLVDCVYECLSSLYGCVQPWRRCSRVEFWFTSFLMEKCQLLLVYARGSRRAISPSSIFQSNVDTLYTWCRFWNLEFVPSKTKAQNVFSLIRRCAQLRSLP